MLYLQSMFYECGRASRRPLRLLDCFLAIRGVVRNFRCLCVRLVSAEASQLQLDRNRSKPLSFPQCLMPCSSVVIDISTKLVHSVVLSYLATHSACDVAVLGLLDTSMYFVHCLLWYRRPAARLDCSLTLRQRVFKFGDVPILAGKHVSQRKGFDRQLHVATRPTIASIYGDMHLRICR
jgi:hypothetical protein